MPSYKPRITVYTDEITNEKLAFIAKNENRSSSNYVEYLIKQAIASYEADKGIIVVPLGLSSGQTTIEEANIANKEMKKRINR